MNNQTSTTSPSPEAMRAAMKISGNRWTKERSSIEELAAIIDRETGVAELREALKNLVRLLDTKDGNLNVELARKDLRKSAPESDLYIKKALSALRKE